MTTHMLYLALVGLGCEGIILGTGTLLAGQPAAWTRTVFAGVMCVWSTRVLVLWKHKERRTALEWGMTDFEEDEPSRPQFKGTVINSPVDGEETLYFLPRKREKAIVLGALVTAAMVCLVVIFMLAMQVFKHQAGFSRRHTTYPATFANAIGIQVFTSAPGSLVPRGRARDPSRCDLERRG